MVAKFKGKPPVKNSGASKPPVKNSGASKPDGKPAAQKAKPIISQATIAKARGGSANIGSGIGNS
jgi:hypothetical protein